MNLSMLSEPLRHRTHRAPRAHRAWWVLALALAAALLLSACDLVGDDAEDDQQQQQSQQVQQQQAQQAETPAATTAAAPAAQPPAQDEGPEPPPEAAGGGSGADAYGIVFPSLALVMTEQAVATGLVISEGYVLVDERSLHGAMAADLLLSNGDTLESVPVVGRDTFTGLAYLGPLDGNLVRRLPGARLGDGEAIRPGSSVFTIGYSPLDTAESLPAVYSGVLSGVSEWEAGQRTFLRTDARPDGATVGMVLVDSAGTVIGIAPASLVGLGWFVSTGDLARSLPPAEIATTRTANPDSASTEHVISAAPVHGAAQLVLADDAAGDSVSLSISSDVAATLQLIDANGDILQESRIIAGATIISLAPDTVGPYTISISSQATMPDDAGDDQASDAMPTEPTYRIMSSAPLMSMQEADATQPLAINTPLVGTIDAPGDADSFPLAIRGGAVYEIRAQSLLVDTLLFVEGSGQDAVDDDSGGGPFGRDSALTLSPVEDGIINITVRDYANEATGAYILTVTQVGGEPPPDDDGADEPPLAGARLPTPMADLSLRGEVTEDGLQPTLLGIGSELGDNGSLIVRDSDGIFEIVASIVASDGSTARIFVFSADDQIVVSGRVIANCQSQAPCLASAVFITPEDAPGPAGEWRVLLQPEGAGADISEWQIEVHRYDELNGQQDAEAEDS